MDNIEFDMNNLTEDEIFELNELSEQAKKINKERLTYEYQSGSYSDNLKKLIDIYDHYRKCFHKSQKNITYNNLMSGFYEYIQVLESVIQNSEKPAVGFHDFRLKQNQTVPFPDLEGEYIFEVKKLRELAKELYNSKKHYPVKTNTKSESSFSDYLLCEEKIELMKTLHSLLDNSKGKEVAIVIKALKIGKFLKPISNSKLYRSMRKEFGDIGTDSGLNFFLNENKKLIDNTDVDKIMINFQEK